MDHANDLYNYDDLCMISKEWKGNHLDSIESIVHYPNVEENLNHAFVFTRHSVVKWKCTIRRSNLLLSHLTLKTKWARQSIDPLVHSTNKIRQQLEEFMNKFLDLVLHQW